MAPVGAVEPTSAVRVSTRPVARPSRAAGRGVGSGRGVTGRPPAIQPTPRATGTTSRAHQGESGRGSDTLVPPDREERGAPRAAGDVTCYRTHPGPTGAPGSISGARPFPAGRA